MIGATAETTTAPTTDEVGVAGDEVGVAGDEVGVAGDVGAAELHERVRRLERRLERARQENQILENMIEEKTRGLYTARADVESGQAYLESVLACMQSSVFITDDHGVVTAVGGTATKLTGWGQSELVGRRIDDVLHPVKGDEHEMETTVSPIAVLVTSSELTHNGVVTGSVYVASDLRDQRQLEVELRHAQRLESIGQLAAGVAHEINTPLQYVSDSAWFLGDILAELIWVIGQYERVRNVVETDEADGILAEIDARAEDMDLDFLKDEAPRAAQRTMDGLERVTKIVRAMKQFAHPGSDDMAPANLREMIESTVTVARNEFKYVADIEVDVDASHEIVCDRADIGQVFINLVVNAAHAIAGQVEGTDGRGEIAIRSRPDEGGMLIEFADTGGGVPAEIRDRIFEPFFTTKDPGKGTGQGLALAYNVVAKHGGRITFDVEDGHGTTFRLWLPGQGEA